MSNLNFRWLKHLSSKPDKVSFEQAVLADNLVLERLRDILKEMEQELDKGEYGYDQFKDPNWAYLQAFRNGDRHRLEQIKQLLSHLDS